MTQPQQQMLEVPREPGRAHALARFSGEHWLASRLGIGGVLAAAELFDRGVSDTATRRERLRAAILVRGPEKVCGHKDGNEVTYRAAFEQLYGVAL